MESASKAVSSLGLDLVSLVTRYLRGEVFVGDVHRWLASHTTWLLTAPPDSATELAGALELALAEMELGHATEDDLRSGILEFLRTHDTLRLLKR
ncbi:MAG: hypothetical protein HYY04_18305 [Chloroflexi bacterium]|nr:hypothetical protein [Chloroflexota bacterium]